MIRQYSNNEHRIFFWVLLPYILIMNALLFGSCAFLSLLAFVETFFISSIYLFLTYFIFGRVAVMIKGVFPLSGELFKRIALMLPVFYLMNIIAISGLVLLYRHLPFVACTVKASMQWWCILYGCIMSTGITFMNEGVANLEAWKDSLAENERLKNLYRRSQLLGLKGQINPHFLFNCFNTLSGLIQEEGDKAERFLDEMTKVHRYLLRYDEELLVPLEEEAGFAKAYLYLAKERFGAALAVSIDVAKPYLQWQLPPLSLQVLLEQIIYANAIDRKDPLHIAIIAEEGVLRVRHTLHEKKILQSLDMDEGLDNLVQKYKMLNGAEMHFEQKDRLRVITLPLFTKEQEVSV